MLTLSKISKKRVSIKNSQDLDIALSFLREYQIIKSQTSLNSILMPKKISQQSNQTMFSKQKIAKSRKKTETIPLVKNKYPNLYLNDLNSYLQKQDDQQINEYRVPVTKYSEPKIQKYRIEKKDTANFQFNTKQQKKNEIIQTYNKLNISPYIDNLSINRKESEHYYNTQNRNNIRESPKHYHNFQNKSTIESNNQHKNYNLNRSQPFQTLKNHEYLQVLNKEDYNQIYQTKITNDNHLSPKYNTNIYQSKFQKQVSLPKQTFQPTSKLAISRLFQPSKITDYVYQSPSPKNTGSYLASNKKFEQNFYPFPFQQKKQVDNYNFLKQYMKSNYQNIASNEEQSANNPLDWVTPPRPMTPPFKQIQKSENIQNKSKQKLKQIPRQKVERIYQKEQINNKKINISARRTNKTDRSYSKIEPHGNEIVMNTKKQKIEKRNNKKQVIFNNMNQKNQDQQNQTVRQVYLDLSNIQCDNDNISSSSDYEDYKIEKKGGLFLQNLKVEEDSEYYDDQAQYEKTYEMHQKKK